MPIYNYACRECKTVVEDVQPITTYKPLVQCPDCKKHTLERTYDGYGGFNLSGRDWPSRDFKRRGR